MSFDEAMAADCCVIIHGYEAKIDMLVATGVLKLADQSQDGSDLPAFTPGIIGRGSKR